ncbi:sialidase family protein [Bacteroides cellulosilyticus]|uniref:sialidase family protein n=1 Tax=Bacteroides cellulosilyticus TaxID=246787 RepID=UPI00356593FB
MKNIINTIFFVLCLLTIVACSDDNNVNDFSPVPYPDEMGQEEPSPTPDEDWKVASSTTVFNSESSDVVSYRVPAIAVTKSGTILVFCETRYGTWKDKAGRTDILMKRSTDKGKTWTEQNITNQSTSSKLSYMDPTVVVDQITGKIFLFTSLWDAVGKESNKQGYNNKAIMYTSGDDGVSWTRKDLTNEVTIGIFSGATRMIGSFGPGSGVQMSSSVQYKNRLIVPIRTFKVNAEAGTVSNGGNTAMWSDDNGVTWETGQPNKSGEWTVTEAPNGTLIGNIRYKGYRQNHYSTDGGQKWGFSDYSATQLPTPAEGCAGSVIVKDDWLYYCGPKGITETDAHDDRGILYLAKAKFFNGHSHTFDAADEMVLYDKAAGYTCMALLPDGDLAIIAELGNAEGFQKLNVRPAGWMRLQLFILSNK